ncbi:MAG TPA: GNAT family N-acetyltransferase [Thermomicrobiales bacterium]|nr:GNAT family N-acetyltransferase [Thermomicrobiales bacterium]
MAKRVTIDVEIVVADWDDPDGIALRAAQRADIDDRYGNSTHEPGGAPSGAEISVFLIARDGDGIACGCGALRQLDAGSAEIKRMYVAPERRGAGVSTAILNALEQHARARHWTTLRLETGSLLPEAMRFYEREGFRRIPNYGIYIGAEDSICYEKHLV